MSTPLRHAQRPPRRWLFPLLSLILGALPTSRAGAGALPQGSALVAAASETLVGPGSTLQLPALPGAGFAQAASAWPAGHALTLPTWTLSGAASPAPTAPPRHDLDVEVFHLINGKPGRHDALDPFFRALMPLGDRYMIALPVGLYGMGRLQHDRDLREAGVLTAASMVSATLAFEGLKGIVGRRRPVEALGEDQVRVVGPKEADGKSFPSGHTATAFAWATALGDLYPKGSAYFYGTAALVGIGRIRMGAHYPSDVLAGAAVGYLAGRLVMSNRSLLTRRGTVSPGMSTAALTRTFAF